MTIQDDSLLFNVVSPAETCDNTVQHNTGLTLDILKVASWAHMGRTANIIIKDIIHNFASISKIMRILLMGRRNRER